MIELGHVVYYVRNLEASLRFYHEAMGLSLIKKIFNNRAAVLSGGGTHHELLLIEVGDVTGPLSGHRIGLYHVGWKVGNSLAELREVRSHLLDNGYEIEAMSDHTVSKSLYLRDPDDNEVELFVDDNNIDWENDDSWMDEPIKPLVL